MTGTASKPAGSSRAAPGLNGSVRRPCRENLVRTKNTKDTKSPCGGLATYRSKRSGVSAAQTPSCPSCSLCDQNSASAETRSFRLPPLRRAGGAARGLPEIPAFAGMTGGGRGAVYISPSGRGTSMEIENVYCCLLSFLKARRGLRGSSSRRRPGSMNAEVRNAGPLCPGRGLRRDDGRDRWTPRRRSHSSMFMGSGLRRNDGGRILGLSSLADRKRNGAQERTRTSTSLRTPAPEAGASTNSATWARGRGRELGGVPALVNAMRAGHGSAAQFSAESDCHCDCHS